MDRPCKLLCVAVAVSLGACDPISVCYSCLESDPGTAVQTSEVSSIRVIRGNKPLPDSVSNVFYEENCGIDCFQSIRFDIPEANAQATMAELTGLSPKTLGLPDQAEIVLGHRTEQEWFDMTPAAGALGASESLDGEGWPIAYLMVPADTHMRVFLYSYSM